MICLKIRISAGFSDSLICVCGSFLQTFPAFLSQFWCCGNSGGLILDTPSARRAIAMGKRIQRKQTMLPACTGIPPGLALLNQSQASFIYNQFFPSMSYQNGSVATPLENGGIGGSLSYLSIPVK